MATGARAGSDESAISTKRSTLGAVTQRGPNDTLFEETFQLEDVKAEWQDVDSGHEDQAGERSYEEYYFEGLPRAGNFPIAFRRQWKDRFQVRPSEYFRELFDTPRVDLGGGVVVAEMDTCGDAQGVEVTCELVHPASSRPVGLMSQAFNFSKEEVPSVHLRQLEFRQESPALGIAKDLLANSVAQYEEMGVLEMTVDAARGIGGHAWARCGFAPEPGERTRQLFSSIRQRLGELELPAATGRTVRELLRADDPKAVWAIADLSGVSATFRGERMSLGQALLTGIEWRGHLDLLEPGARARFDQYVDEASDPTAGEVEA